MTAAIYILQPIIAGTPKLWSCVEPTLSSQFTFTQTTYNCFWCTENSVSLYSWTPIWSLHFLYFLRNGKIREIKRKYSPPTTLKNKIIHDQKKSFIIPKVLKLIKLLLEFYHIFFTKLRGFKVVHKLKHWCLSYAIS